MSETHTLTTKLGRITGAVSENTVQYRGIPYARIPGRFKDPIGPLDTFGDFDGTKWGPMAPQLPNTDLLDANVMNHGFTPMSPGRGEMSELECTNLVIVTPYKQETQSSTLLPTIVWVHGGGNRVGSANFTGYDMTNLVKHSINVAGKPLVVVSLNHRLGSFGYLASEEIGATGNYGLKDQAMGLKWVIAHIKEFGGDPNNITFMGESAGSTSGSVHLSSKTPLFNKAILLSGITGLLPPCPIAVQNEVYKKTCKNLGVPDVSTAAERQERIFAASASEISDITLTVPACPTSDGDIIPSTGWVRYEECKPLPEWCDSVVIGSCRDEWTIMGDIGNIAAFKNPLKVFRHRLSSILPGASIDELLSRFGITKSDPKETTIHKIHILASQYAFRFPGYHFIQHWTSSSKKAFYAQFAVLNPLPGINQGTANHGVDVVFSFQNHTDEMPETGGYRELVGEVATAWCRYAYGEDPWKQFDSDGAAVKVFDVGDKGGVKKIQEFDPEEWETWKVIEKLGLDKVWEAIGEYFDGPREGDPE